MDRDPSQQALSDATILMGQRRFSEAEQKLQPLVATGRRANDGPMLCLYAEAAFYRILHGGGDFGDAERLVYEAMNLSDLPGIYHFNCLNRLGTIAYHRDRYQDAILIYREALRALPVSAETRMLRNRLGGNLAEALRSSDEPEAAHVEYLKVMEQLDGDDDLYMQGALYLGMAANDHDRRCDDLAIRRALHAQTLFNRLGDPLLSTQAGLHLGYFFISGQLMEHAAEVIYAHLNRSEVSDNRTLKFLSRYDLAVLRLQHHDYSDAEDLALAAYREASEAGLQRFVAHSATLLAELAERTCDYETATARWREAGDVCERLGLIPRAGQIWQRLGMLLSQRGDSEGSRRYVQRALSCLDA